MQNKLVVFSTLLLFTMYSGYAEAQETAEKEDYSVRGIERWAFRTNALEWILTVPNFGIEYDLSSSPYNRTSVGISAYYNWNTHHTDLPYNVFNVFMVKPEARYYWRAYNRKKDIRPHGASYIGIYAESGSYSLKLSEYGHQGFMAGAGITLGHSVPLYEYGKGALDVEFGISLGIKAVSDDAYRLDEDANAYISVPEKSTGMRLLPYPVASELSITFVWRKKSISKKYFQVNQERQIQRQMKKTRTAKMTR